MDKERPGAEKQETSIVPYEQSRKLAEELLARFRKEIDGNLHKDVDGWGEPHTSFQKSIRHFLEQIPEDVLRHYTAHGVTRHDEIGRLTAALNILANKRIKGWYGRLMVEPREGYDAYIHGDFSDQ